MMNILRSCAFRTVLCTALGIPLAGQTGGDPFDPLATAKDAETRPRPTNALDKGDLEFYLRHVFVWGPQIKMHIGDPKPSGIKGLLEVNVRATYKMAVEERTVFVSDDGKHVIEGKTYPIDDNPFRKTLDKITTEGHPGFGTEGAPVQIVAYADFQCPACAKESKILRGQLLQEFPEDIRVYFRDYPLATHNWALAAAKFGRCIYQTDPEKFWAYHDWIFENQKSVTPQNLPDKVGEFAGRHGLDSIKLATCASDPKTAKIIDESIGEGQALKVRSTPSVFINGRMLTGAVPFENLKQIIENEIEYQKVAQDAGDDCGCSIPLEFPGAE